MKIIKKHSQALFKVLVILFAIYCLFWNLGKSELAEWDETRYGQNAFEMLKNGDYVNYSFNGKLDLWNAKPPLQVWLITISYRVFGFNEWGLRIPSAVGGGVALIFIFLLCRLLFSSSSLLGQPLAWWGVLIAATSHGLIGGHTSRTGEMDAWFVATLTATVFFLIRSERLRRPGDLIWSGVALGIAFYTKGVAVAFILPGCFLYLLFSGKFKAMAKQWQFWAGLAAFLAFVMSWFTLVSIYGKTDPNQVYQGSNVFYVMLFFDIWARFRGTMNAEPDPFDPFYLPRAFDLRFSPWWYLCLLFTCSYFFLKGRLQARLRKAKAFSSIFKSMSGPREAVRIALIFGLPICIMLFVSRHKLEWYVAPLTPFFVLLTLGLTQLIDSFETRFAKIAFSVAVIVGVGNQIRTISFNPYVGVVRDFMYEHRYDLPVVEEITPSRNWRQVERLYLNWYSNARLIESDVPYTHPIGRIDWSCDRSVKKCRMDFVAP